MIPRAAVALALLLAIAGAPAGAQRPPARTTPAARAPAISPAEARALAIRAELAEVLLQSQRYAEAAREYGRLVEADSTNTSYRLGLARSLAWGGKYREAERELRTLAVTRPRDATVDTLLRSVRQSMQPRSSEAAAWVREQPRYTPYRFALARALVRERNPRAALVQYDSLLALGATPALLREMSAAYRAANDLPGVLALLRTAVTRAPSDTAVRRTYAMLLVEARDLDAALAQSDTILLSGRSPAALLERAQINIAREDLDAAIIDLRASIAAGPTEDAYLTLGDIHRWRGEYSTARTFYGQARTLSPGSREVAARFGQLARDERPAVTLLPRMDVYAGWRAGAAHASDNVGTQYSTISTHRGFTAPLGLRGSAGVEIRHLRERVPSTGEAQTTGYAAEAALARGASYGALHGELSGTGGVVTHSGAGSRLFGAVAVTGQYYAWAATAEMASGPAYTSLLTTAFLTSSDEGPWLTEQTVSASLAGPIAQADAGISVRQSDISDGNRRTALQAYVRYPISRRLAAVYSGSTVAFDNRSPLYWDPSSHITNTLGIQVAERRLRGLSYSASIHPGVAWAEDTPYLRAPVSELDGNRLRPQISASGELTYRTDRWEIGAAYGWGRLASYQRNDARIGLRFVP